MIGGVVKSAYRRNIMDKKQIELVRAERKAKREAKREEERRKFVEKVKARDAWMINATYEVIAHDGSGSEFLDLRHAARKIGKPLTVFMRKFETSKMRYVDEKFTVRIDPLSRK